MYWDGSLERPAEKEEREKGERKEKRGCTREMPDSISSSFNMRNQVNQARQDGNVHCSHGVDKYKDVADN